MVDWKKLEAEVNSAIEKGCPISFETKSLVECKYQQKCAENKRSYYETLTLSIIIFIIVIGISYMLTTYKDKDSVSNLIFWGGLFIIIGGFIAYLLWRHPYNRCNRIILDAEQRILSETDVEPRQTQLIANTLPQAQENTLPRNPNIAQIEYIKARLDLLKIILTAFIGAVFAVAIYNIQTSGSNFIIVMLASAILIFSFAYFFRKYVENMNKLKDLP